MSLISVKEADPTPGKYLGYVGKVGEMVNLPCLRVEFAKQYFNERGSYWLYKFATEIGDTIKAFYSGAKFEAKVGDVVSIRCKVKEHQEWNGMPETMVSHISLIEEDYARTGEKPSKRHSSKREGGPLTRDENWGADIPIDESVGF